MNYNDAPTQPIEQVDYELAALAYRALAWRWASAANGCPSAAEIARAIQVTASQLSVMDDWIASGGYFVTANHGEMRAGFDRKLQAAMDEMRKARG